MDCSSGRVHLPRTLSFFFPGRKTNFRLPPSSSSGNYSRHEEKEIPKGPITEVEDVSHLFPGNYRRNVSRTAILCERGGKGGPEQIKRSESLLIIFHFSNINSLRGPPRASGGNNRGVGPDVLQRTIPTWYEGFERYVTNSHPRTNLRYPSENSQVIALLLCVSAVVVTPGRVGAGVEKSRRDKNVKMEVISEGIVIAPRGSGAAGNATVACPARGKYFILQLHNLPDSQ